MIKKIKTFFLICTLFFVSSCAHKNPLTAFQFQTLTVPPYVVASWYRIASPGLPLRIYIEGDGHSFDAYNRPTNNPTPRSTFLRDIAAADPNPNVVYLARPCQYLQTNTCTQDDWTSGRFSNTIINSMNQSVQMLAKKARTNKLTLIGYSGGAQVAGLIAVRNDKKVQKIITIAGVLDQEAWTAHHHDSPLINSLNLKNYQEAFSKIPQIHFVGGKDKVVPYELTLKFVNDESKIVIVPNANHQKGFDSIIQKIYQMD